MAFVSVVTAEFDSSQTKHKNNFVPDLILGPIAYAKAGRLSWGVEFTVYDMMSMSRQNQQKDAYYFGANFEACVNRPNKVFGVGLEYMLWNKILSHGMDGKYLISWFVPNPQVMLYYTKDGGLDPVFRLFEVVIPAFVEYDYRQKDVRYGFYLKTPILFLCQ